MKMKLVCLLVVLAGLLTGLALRPLFGAQAVWWLGGLAAALFAGSELRRTAGGVGQEVAE
mgnify:CR=1 FL=1